MSKIPFAEPIPAGSRRARAAKAQRDLATEIARLRPQALTLSNGEEADSDGLFASNFTKGLLHDDNGLLVTPRSYHCFVEGINAADRHFFDKHVPTGEDTGVSFACTVNGGAPKWRGWESPRSGHVYELQGPDAGAVGMAPAPRVGSSELSAEMAEVYALAILRDVPFTEIAKGAAGSEDRICGGKAQMKIGTILDDLNGMAFFTGSNVRSSTPQQIDAGGLNRFERNRRDARTIASATLDGQTAFRGSTIGAQTGPYISQFMLAGTTGLGGATGGAPSYPAKASAFDPEDGYISYGNQIIDQRVTVHKECLDHMTSWPEWLDVQNGANFKGANLFEDERRFITTPRDLATYVHFDALYQAYLNAALILLGIGTPASRGFPEPSPNGARDSFATFGGPHILSLVTEVATRCLKAVRRQKFNYHRRCRPETLGGRAALVGIGRPGELGAAETAFQQLHDDIPARLRKAIVDHNKDQNSAAMKAMRLVQCAGGDEPSGVNPNTFADNNLLLPMAFPEGSPMHPAYGAGHATVAGGCVTMLKAFFDMFADHDGGTLRILKLGDKDYFEPSADGKKLVNRDGVKLTVQGELDKLAANIAIGRNMAGVHYYSDYYDSLRLGERIAIGILMEQIPTYGESVTTAFDSFDADRIVIRGEPESCPTLAVTDRHGNRVGHDDWWLRHVPGQEVSEDLMH